MHTTIPDHSVPQRISLSSSEKPLRQALLFPVCFQVTEILRLFPSTKHSKQIRLISKTRACSPDLQRDCKTTYYRNLKSYEISSSPEHRLFQDWAVSRCWNCQLQIKSTEALQSPKYTLAAGWCKDLCAPQLC